MNERAHPGVVTSTIPTGSVPAQTSAPTRATLHRPRRMGHAGGTWVVAFAFLSAMAFSVVPTPLWPLYQQQDGFSTFVVTIAFAAYAVGVILSLFLLGHVSDWVGRKRILVPALAIEVVSAVVFIVWNDLPGLLIARVLCGIGIGMITATATAHITELFTRAHPDSDPSRAGLLSTGANMGGFAIGSLVSGLLTQFVALPLVTPYVVFIVVLLGALVAMGLVPETVPAGTSRPYRPQRIAVPRSGRGAFFAAAAIAFGAFSVFGLFSSLAPVLLAGRLAITDHAVAGLVVAAVFGSAAVSQLLVGRLSTARQLGLGTALLVVGLAGVTLSLVASSLALVLVGGVLAGAGAGILFKASLATAGRLASPAHRGETLAGIFLAGYLGLVVPVLGIGIAVLTIPQSVAVLGFAIVAAAVVLLGVLALSRRRA